MVFKCLADYEMISAKSIRKVLNGSRPCRALVEANNDKEDGHNV